MDIVSSLDRLADEFVDRPIDFVLEADLQARIYEMLRSELRSRGELYADWDPKWHGLELGGHPEHMQENVGKIKDKVEQKVETAGESPFSRVHTEVMIMEPFAGDRNEMLDLAVFEQTGRRPVIWNDGSKRFDAETIDTAIELKFVKNKAKFPCSLSFSEVENLDQHSLRDEIDLTSNSIQADVDELEYLASEYTTTDAYFVLYSNYDYLYRSTVASDSRRHRIYEKIGNAVCAELREQCDEISVQYVHPMGSEWIVRN